MKKILLIAAIAVSSISTQAQVSFGAQVGANFGLGHAKDDYFSSPLYSGVALANNPKVGPVVGLVAEVGFGKLAFRPELNFIQKGSKSGLAGYDQKKISLSYVEVPLNVVYKLELGKIGKVFFGVGPAVGFGLGGKIKSNGSNGTYSQKVKFDGEKDANVTDTKAHFKRLDIGANVLAGFQMKMGVFARLSYTHGFANLYPDKTYTISGTKYDQSYKNRGISLTVGYMLGKK